MKATDIRVGYVVKRYPRFSETFIVNEILAHEAAGHSLEIFSLYPPNDTHFQDTISHVRAPVTYLTAEGLRATDFWSEMQNAAAVFPGFWAALEASQGAEAREVLQAIRLARLAHQRGLHVLHAHFASTAASVARLAARFSGLPYTVTAHAKDIFHEAVCQEELARRLSEAALAITVSDFNVNFLRKRHGAAAANVRRLYNGIELKRFPFTNPDGRQRRIVSVGRLVEKKGFSVLVSACAMLARQGVDFSCEIIGVGELEAALKVQIRSSGLEHRVRLVGALPQRDVISRVQNAAVFAAPCVIGSDGNADGLPTVLLEAMALGTPCVATDVTGIPEIVFDGETGRLVRQNDPGDLSNALGQILGDEGLRTRLAHGARDLIEREFDISRNAATQWEWFRTASEAREGGDTHGDGIGCASNPPPGLASAARGGQMALEVAPVS